MFDSAVPRYIAFLSLGRLVSIAFEKELLVSGLFNVDCSHKIPDYWMSMSNLHSKPAQR